MPISFTYDKNSPLSSGIFGEDLRVTLKRAELPLFLQCKITGAKWALDEGCQIEIQEAILLAGSATPALVGWNVYALLTNSERAALLQELRKQADAVFLGWRAGQVSLVPGVEIGMRPVADLGPRPSFPHHSCDNICVTEGCENMPLTPESDA